nr:hypothetical protein Itr_chr03CG10250 [Ipomoea trifida]
MPLLALPTPFPTLPNALAIAYSAECTSHRLLCRTSNVAPYSAFACSAVRRRFPNRELVSPLPSLQIV